MTDLIQWPEAAKVDRVIPKERLYATGETPSEFPKCSLSTEADLNPASAATCSIES